MHFLNLIDWTTCLIYNSGDKIFAFKKPQYILEMLEIVNQGLHAVVHWNIPYAYDVKISLWCIEHCGAGKVLKKVQWLCTSILIQAEMFEGTQISFPLYFNHLYPDSIMNCLTFHFNKTEAIEKYTCFF